MQMYQICFIAYLKDSGAQMFYTECNSDQIAGIEKFEWPVPADMVLIAASITAYDEKGNLVPDSTYFGFKWKFTFWECLVMQQDFGMNRLNLDVLKIIPDSGYRKKGEVVLI